MTIEKLKRWHQDRILPSEGIDIPAEHHSLHGCENDLIAAEACGETKELEKRALGDDQPSDDKKEDGGREET